MKTLVIPDLHHRIGWVEAVVADERPDRIVFLGDGFDNKGSRRSIVMRMVDFFHKWLLRDDVVWLMGNHDAQYLLQHRELHCTGYDKFTDRLLTDHRLGIALPRQLLLDRVRLCHYEQGWLLSHAGFHAGLCHPVHGLAPEWLVPYEREVMQQARLGMHPWLEIGDPRRNEWAKRGYTGGVFWQDWDEEFQPIAGVNQIVGHSHVDAPSWKGTGDSLNLCLDTDARHYALITDGIVTVHPHRYAITKDAKPLPTGPARFRALTA